MTLEGCVVRLSDIIAYLGRDIEDAEKLGLFNKKDIPKEISNVLGTTNREIVNAIITNVVQNSLDKDFKSDIMEYIKKLTSNQNLSPFMKIYYCRHYYIGEIEQNEIRITVDEDIVFENCLTNEKKTLNESIMEIKAEKNESFDEDVLASAIETIFKKACIQRSTSKKMLGYTLVM